MDQLVAHGFEALLAGTSDSLIRGNTVDILAMGAGIAAFEPGPGFRFDSLENDDDDIRLVELGFVTGLYLAARHVIQVDIEIDLRDQDFHVGIVFGQGIAQLQVPHPRRL